MNISDIAAQRMHNQFLLKPVTNPLKVMQALGAMQAQDFPAAKWALGLRSKNATDESITKLFNDGKILRTHILRPTWHFVLPEDIRWVQSLTAPRVHAFNKYYYKKVDLDDATLNKSIVVLKSTLKGGTHLTRKEVAEAYKDAGIDTSGLRLGYLLMYAELEAIICSGAMKGKQHTVALLAERAPQAHDLPKEQALTELTKRFFSAHGPATIQDFAWWSSLTVADIKAGIAKAGLSHVEVGGKTFYFAKKTKTTIPSPVVHLLPNYDEYGIAYKVRQPFLQAKLDRKPANEDLFYHLVTLDGQIIGGWRRVIAKDAVIIHPTLFKELTTKESQAFGQATLLLQDFLQTPVAVQK